MQIVSNADNLYEMLNHVFCGKIRIILSVELAQRVVKVTASEYLW